VNLEGKRGVCMCISVWCIYLEGGKDECVRRCECVCAWV